MFCPNCGTQNPETAQTCSKCNFNLKGAAAPKFKGTMLMMNQPGGAPAAPPAPPRPAGAPAAPAPGGPSKLKGTMVGVAPPVPMPGAPAAPPPAPAFTPPPAPEPAAFNPPGQAGQQVNPLGGTMVADNAPAYAPPPAPAGDPFGPPPGGAPGFGAAPPAQDPYGAPPGQYGGQQGFPGAPPPAQPDYAGQAAAGIGQAANQMEQAFGGMAAQAGFGGAPQQPYGAPPAGGYGAPGAAPMQQGGPPGSEVNTTMPLVLGIVSTLCCGLAAVCGIIAIVFSMQAKTLAQQGQLDAARAKVGTAKLLGFIGLGLGLLTNIGVAIVKAVL